MNHTLGRGVFFASKLYCGALAKRVSVTILYATETGKSQLYAHYLSNIFKSNFNPNVSAIKLFLTWQKKKNK